MAITDIISEEIETSTPNMEVAQGGPEDFMTDDEMDPYQDPEFQQLLDSLPGEQAEVLMQLIKEFKAMVAQGFEGEFEDFVKMKMASAQGGPEEFMSEEEMTISPEEQQSIIPMGQQVAQGGRIGYDNGGPTMGNPPVFEKIEDMREWRIANPDVEDIADYKGYYDRLKNPEDYDKDGFKKKRNKKYEGGIMDVVEEEQVETGPTSQQLIMKWLNDRNLPITPENIQRAIMEMSREGQAPAMPREQMAMAPMEAPRPPSGSDYVPEELIGQDITETVTPNVAEAGIMQVDDPTLYKDDERTRWLEEVDRLKNAQGAFAPDSYIWMMNEKIKEGVNQGWATQDDYLNYQQNFLGEGGEQLTDRINKYREDSGLNFAQGGRIGYAYGDQVTADSPGIMSQVPGARAEQIEKSQAYDDAMQKIINKFYEKFPGVDSSEMNIEDMVAELQAEGVGEHATDILSFAAGMDMITPESVRRSTRALDRHGRFDFPEDEEHQFDHPVDEMMGRSGYGLGSLVKSVFKGAKSAVKGITKSVKKFAKSDLGKLALTYLATAGMANIGAAGGFGKASWANPFTKGTGWLRPSSVMGNLGKSWGNIGKAFKGGQTDKLVSGTDWRKNIKIPGVTTSYDKPASLGSKLLGSFKTSPMPWILGTSGLAGLYTKKNPGDTNLDNLMGNYKGEVGEWDKMLADIRSGQGVTPFATDNVLFPYPNYHQLAGGGRVGRAEGGLMDLGGLEKDYRAEGGFVPIGKKEKADDVPARLSVNEFVFTADAVRNAGGGDVDRGAEVMENVMTNLEQGGSISEESQGLEGARDMFEVSERLSEVV